MPVTADEYDVIVIGAGPTGQNVADYARRGGLSVAVVEAELVGGECSYWACIPSKAMLRPPAAVADARRVDGAAQAVLGRLDPTRVLARRDTFTRNWSDAPEVAWLEESGIALVRGRGRLAGERRVEVESAGGAARTLTARHAVALCTGTRASIPPIPGLADADPWISRDATSAKDVPPRLAILGGGVVACEMATAYRALRSEVSLVVRGGGLLERVEPFAGEAVRDALRAAGADVRLGTSTTRVMRDDSGVVLTVADGSGHETALRADELLVATGRTPATTGLGVETVGLSAGRPVPVDDTCLVSGVPGEWLYAAGDVNGRSLMTHMGKYQGRACGRAIAARARGERVAGTPWSPHAATADHRAVPQVVFTDPEVAAVGLTEREARDRGMDVRAVEYDLGAVAGASLYADGYAGRAKLVVDADRELLVGATFVGAGVSELVHAATVAVVGEVPLDRLWHAVPSFPTMSEVWLRLLEQYLR